MHVLGIDIGSTAARAAIAWREGDETRSELVPFKFAEEPEGHGYPLFEASSDILPFDDGPIKYIRHGFSQDCDLKREKLPAKFVPYVLLDKIEDMEEQNPVGIRLKQQRSKAGLNDTLFKANIEDATKQFLRYILMCSKKALDMRKQIYSQLRITTVAMAVPSQWNASFQSLYGRLLKEVFAECFEEMDDIEVVFHTDATAIAHYFLHSSSDANGLELRQHGIIPDIDTVGGGINTQLFIHCGAHHASSILTTIQRDESGKRVLCEGGRSQGAEGGTEWWLEDLLNYVINGIVVPIHEIQLSGVTPEDRNLYREIIAERYRPIMNGRGSLGIPPPQHGWSHISTQIPKERSDQACHLGFRHVKRMIRQQLQRISNIKRGWGTKEHAITIIVTGGSTRHPAFIKWLEDSCAEQGLPKAITLETMARFCGAEQVARGAAYATLAQQASNMAAPETPRRRIPEFGSEEARANIQRLMDLKFPHLKSFGSNTTADARPDGATKHSPNDNVSLSGEASSSRQMDSESKAPGADTSQDASRKRKASEEPDDFVPTKHVHTMRGLPIRTKSSTTKEPRDVVPANRVHNTRGLAIRTASAARKDASSSGKGGSST
ncbi:hypothetical protein SLS64_012996 [Diaporthe eres]